MKLQTYIALELLKVDDIRSSLNKAILAHHCDSIEEGAAKIARSLCRQTGDDPNSQVKEAI